MITPRLLAVLALGGCMEVQTYGKAAVDYRMSMNDLQTQSVMLEMCDLSLGSVGRVLTDDQLRFAVHSCWGDRAAQLLKEAP